MPKLHSRHVPHRGGGLRGKSSAFRLILQALLALLFVGLLWLALNTYSSSTSPEEAPYYAPTSTTGQVVVHHYFALSYLEDWEIAEWVAWELERDKLRKKRVRRQDNYRPDPKVRTGSAEPEDYRGSGWDRGHLAPAADMAFSKKAMSESFLMSNIAPQDREFNNGIWHDLEVLTRHWAKRFKHLYVIAGPITSLPPIEYIGRNRVAVPRAFYKVILDLSQPELKGIAFVIPNKPIRAPLSTFATTIDSVEQLTGIDFFPQFMEDSLEKVLESQIDLDLWAME